MNSVLGALGDLGVGLSKIVATGGEDCLGAVDCLDYFLDVDPPAAIGCALDQVKDLPRFRAACGRARSLGVPIVVLKTGRSEVGARAALAHSGSLAGDDAMFDAALRQSGAIRVENLTELVSLLALQSKLHPRVLENRAFVMTISGGETGLTADLAEMHGIRRSRPTIIIQAAPRGATPTTPSDSRSVDPPPVRLREGPCLRPEEFDASRCLPRALDRAASG